MNVEKLINYVKTKFGQKIYLGAIMAFTFTAITMFSAPTNVHADTWSATLPKATGVTQGRFYVRTNVTPKISLTRIVNGPSYYIRAQMVNSNGQPRTNDMLVQQNAGYKVFTGNSMSKSYKYKLLVSNQRFETTARSAYGYIQI